ncbi:hypothetical protein [Mycoplasmopsis primatum]|uniref:hypothetical protein n=1 Tax=Mycoplasmopsis primatum TaxID=55604 RepID=UPI0004977041|nr:hypothetical protein [Mycoplasmopsis primatum]
MNPKNDEKWDDDLSIRTDEIDLLEASNSTNGTVEAPFVLDEIPNTKLIKKFEKADPEPEPKQYTANDWDTFWVPAEWVKPSPYSKREYIVKMPYLKVQHPDYWLAGKRFTVVEPFIKFTPDCKFAVISYRKDYSFNLASWFKDPATEEYRWRTWPIKGKNLKWQIRVFGAISKQEI